MMKPAYILSACAISPQESYEPSAFLEEIFHTGDGKLFVKDPDYSRFINPVAIRRMSRQMKMGITAAMRSLELAGVTTPDAIITGTSLGSMTDMEHFLKDMIRFNEEALNPTYFIQSTYNSVNGWIALQSKSIGYNQTFVNRGFSFELSLLDAQLLLEEAGENKYALVGCFDEMTSDYFLIKNKIDYWKKQLPDSLSLLQHNDTPGTIAGEGTAFFTLSNNPEGAMCTMLGIKMMQDPLTMNMGEEIENFLADYQLSPQDIDVVICGMNGDSKFEPVYEQALDILSQQTEILVYKHLTGEYPTASGFAVWLATRVFNSNEIPAALIYSKGERNAPRYILILNHYILNTGSLILLAASETAV